tara:strand:+ start:358 stop:579 length:222 start_codon:yes stop_codon:yes gene_type:complete
MLKKDTSASLYEKGYLTLPILTIKYPTRIPNQWPNKYTLPPFSLDADNPNKSMMMDEIKLNAIKESRKLIISS